MIAMEPCPTRATHLIDAKQFARLATQHDSRSAQMGLEFIQRGFNFPSFVIQRRQFCGWRLVWIQDRRDQPIEPS